MWIGLIYSMIMSIDVREIFCQGRQSTILRPNEILDRLFSNVFALFLYILVIYFLKIELFREFSRENS